MALFPGLTKLFGSSKTEIIEADKLFSYLASISHNPDAIESFLYRYNRLKRRYKKGDDKIFIKLYLEWESFIVTDQPTNNRKYTTETLHKMIRHEINIDKFSEEFRIILLPQREQVIALYHLFINEIAEYISKEVSVDALTQALKYLQSDPLLAKIRTSGKSLSFHLIENMVTPNEIDYPIDSITKSFRHMVASLYATIEKYKGESATQKLFTETFQQLKNTYDAKIVAVVLKIVPEKILDMDDWLSLMSKQELERQVREKTDELASLNTHLEQKIEQRMHELQQAYEELKKLDQKKSEFVSVAAHQLRTPLSGLKWTLSMLEQGDLGPVNDEQKEFIKKGLGTTDTVIGIINELLEIDLLVRDKVLYNIKPTNIVPLIERAIIDLAPQARRNNIVIKPPHLPKGTQIITEIDESKISIVIQNLIDNAIKYSKPNGAIEVGLTKVNTTVQISIKDNGIGISKEDQEGIFDRFFRAGNAVRKATEGSGIGLFVAKNIVEDHDGRIWFDSVENKGTTFYVTLPLLNSNHHDQGLRNPFAEA